MCEILSSIDNSIDNSELVRAIKRSLCCQHCLNRNLITYIANFKVIDKSCCVFVLLSLEEFNLIRRVFEEFRLCF